MQKRDHGTGHDVRGGVTGCSLLDSAFSMLRNHQYASKRQLYREKSTHTPPESAGFKSYRSQRHFRTPVTHFRSGSAYSYAPHPAGEAALAAPLPGCAEYNVNARPSSKIVAGHYFPYIGYYWLRPRIERHASSGQGGTALYPHPAMQERHPWVLCQQTRETGTQRLIYQAKNKNLLGTFSPGLLLRALQDRLLETGNHTRW